MRRFAPMLALAALAGVAPLAHADKGPDDLYVGVGMFTDILNVNVEYVSEDWGNVVLRVGEFQDVNEGLAGNVSWRKPVTSDNPKESGYFIGVFAGHVRAEQFGKEAEFRLGGGGEFGYHWVTDYTRKVFSVGIGTAEEVEYNGMVYEAEPSIFFEFSISLGL